MTTDHDIEAALRHALHEAADPVEPAGDGLQIIQRRLQQPPLQRQISLLLTETADLIFLIGIRLEPAATRARTLARQAFTHLRAWLGSATSVPAAGHRRRGPAHRSQPAGRLASRLSPAMAWLRPTLAVVGAVAIVVAGVATLFTLRQTVTDISLLTGGSQSQAPRSPGQSPAGHTAAPGTTSPSAPLATGKARPKRTRHVAGATPTCTPTAVAQPPAVSASPSASATPSGTPSATPTASDTTTPSPTPSAGNTGAAINTPAVGQSAVGTTVQLTSGCLTPLPTTSSLP